MADAPPTPAPVALPTTSATTKKCYESCLNRLKAEELFGLIQKHPKLVVTWINTSASKSGSIDTQNSYITALLWYLRTESPTTDLTPYTTESKRLQLLRNEKSKKQVLPEGKMTHLVEWNDVLTAGSGENEKKLTKDDILIYKFYTLMPPLRADFANLSIYKREIPGRAGNYILESKNTKKWRLVLQEYKTAKTFGKQVVSLPQALIPYIQSARGDSDVVLEMSENALSKRVSSIFENLSGTSMSINLLRHSFIKHFLSVKRSILEKEQMALRMLHSKTLQEQYDLLPQPVAQPDAVAQAVVIETAPEEEATPSDEEHSLDFLA